MTQFIWLLVYVMLVGKNIMLAIK